MLSLGLLLSAAVTPAPGAGRGGPGVVAFMAVGNGGFGGSIQQTSTR